MFANISPTTSSHSLDQLKPLSMSASSSKPICLSNHSTPSVNKSNGINMMDLNSALIPPSIAPHMPSFLYPSIIPLMVSNAVIMTVRGTNNLPTILPMTRTKAPNLPNLDIISMISLPDDLTLDIILPMVFCQRLLSKSPTSESIVVKPLNLRAIPFISLAILPSSATLKKVFTIANCLAKKRLIPPIILAH